VALESLYIATMAFFKISLGLFFLRVLTERWQKIFVYCILVIITAYSVGYLFFSVFRCGVPSGDHFWQQKLANKCTPGSYGLGFGYTHAILTAGTDIIFLFLSIHMVRHSSLKFREKVTVLGIFILATM
jgi:hypothetical protein